MKNFVYSEFFFTVLKKVKFAFVVYFWQINKFVAVKRRRAWSVLCSALLGQHNVLEPIQNETDPNVVLNEKKLPKIER